MFLADVHTVLSTVGGLASTPTAPHGLICGDIRHDRIHSSLVRVRPLLTPTPGLVHATSTAEATNGQ